VLSTKVDRLRQNRSFCNDLSTLLLCIAQQLQLLLKCIRYPLTFVFKATDVRANNVKLLRYVAETLLWRASHLNSADNVYISAITAIAAQCIAMKC